MSEWQFTITKTNRMALVGAVADVVKQAPVGYVLTIAEPDLSRLQQKKFHALIGDIARCCTFKGHKWGAASWKRLLVESFVNVERDDARARGLADPFPETAFLVEGLDGRSIVQLGEQTRTFSRQQSSAFVESLYAYGEEKFVIWSEPSKQVIREVLGKDRAA